MEKINIAIDGPAASGKGTVARLVAKKLDYLYVDTGAMYRIVAFLMIRKSVDFDDNEGIKQLLDKDFEYSVKNERYFLNGEDVSDGLRSKEVNKIVSFVAGKQFVRDYLIAMQKSIAKGKGVIMDGRDITSVVLKDAELKIYLDASFEERVKRRYLEEINKGMNSSIDEVREMMRIRDNNDLNGNKTLVKCDDSIVVDTTNLTIEEATNKVYGLARDVILND